MKGKERFDLTRSGRFMQPHPRVRAAVSLLMAVQLLMAVLLLMCVPQMTFAAQTAAQTDAAVTSGTADTEKAAFEYEHDPRENPAAMEDIVVNPDAVYGFSPNPDSRRLGVYADALDWTDEEAVAQARQQRREYHDETDQLYRVIEEMLGQGKNVEEIARAVSAKRNEIRLESYKDDPEGLAKVKQSNLDTYGNEDGPTADSLYEKYGSWLTVMEKALSTNPGMDACLGFYDEYYDTYDILESVPDEDAAAKEKEEQKDEQEKDEQEITEQEKTGQEKTGQEKTGQEKTGQEKTGQEKEDGNTYTVEKGNCLWRIADKQLGNGSRWTEIYELNKERIPDPNLIYAGQEFVMPAA